MITQKAFKNIMIQKGWQPYIFRHELDIKRARLSYIITFKRHESFMARVTPKNFKALKSLSDGKR